MHVLCAIFHRRNVIHYAVKYIEKVKKCNFRIVFLGAIRRGNTVFSRKSPRPASYVRTTLRISHMPHSVTSTLPVHTATGGTAPDLACDTPNIKSG